jgi:hypothetical protein
MHGPWTRAEVAAPLLSLVALAVAASCGHAQQAARPQPELRADVIDVRSTHEGTVQAGAGVGIPLGYYARFGIVAGGGITRRDDVQHGSGRIDLVVRFLLDPFREARWGLSIGAGMSVMYEAQEDWRELVLVAIDLESPAVHRRLVPALQLGLGGGARVGLIVRSYQQGRR